MGLVFNAISDEPGKQPDTQPFELQNLIRHLMNNTGCLRHQMFIENSGRCLFDPNRGRISSAPDVATNMQTPWVY